MKTPIKNSINEKLNDIVKFQSFLSFLLHIVKNTSISYTLFQLNFQYNLYISLKKKNNIPFQS